MTELTPARRRELRASAHHLSPVVSIAGNGLTPAVLGEIDRSLQAHELIKIKVHGAERDAREELMKAVCDALDASPVQHIGTILVVWRERREDETGTAPAKPASAGPGKGSAKAKSARAFAAAARRAALVKASDDKRRLAEKRSRSRLRPVAPARSK